MKLGIMQPYFFPYIGYFSLIQYSDCFVFFDTPQYIRKGWINRNRVLGQNHEPVYINVPVMKTDRSTPINQIVIANQQSFRETILGQLTVYKRRAPYYTEIIELVREVLYKEYHDIGELAIESIVRSCEYLNVDLKYDIFSKMEICPSIKVSKPDEWALEITKAMGYETYVNPPGGKSFFDRNKYREAGIELEFLTAMLPPYNQRNATYIPGLSIIDAMMFCTVQEITEMMRQFIIE